jgi:hypothetical protein
VVYDVKLDRKNKPLAPPPELEELAAREIV